MNIAKQAVIESLEDLEMVQLVKYLLHNKEGPEFGSPTPVSKPYAVATAACPV